MEKYIPKAALIAEIEKELNATKKYSTEYVNGKKYALKKILSILDTLETKDVDLEKEFNDFPDNIEAVPQWHNVEEQPLPHGTDVLAYNNEWVNEWTPNGIRIGYLSEEGFVSAKYCTCDEDYVTCSEDGDDYDTWQEQSDGSVKTWYNNDGNIKEGYRPNMPTHYMLIPNCKAQKGE